MINSSSTLFGLFDWLVLAVYFVILVISGIFFARKQTTTDDYFRASGQIPMWAAGISFLATSLSAATFIGGPQQAFAGDLTYLISIAGSILAVLIVAIFFVPSFYRYQVTTVYELLGKHFGPLATLSASGAFMLGRVFASGARIYIAALPASLIIFGDIDIGHLLIAIAALTVIGIVYTFVGGIRSVIWTDCIQMVIFVGAAIVAIIILLQKIPVPLTDIIDTLNHPAGDAVEQTSKLAFFRLGFDGIGSKHTYTLLTAIFGFTLLNLGAYGTDQDMAQRLLTCRSAVKGSWSAIIAVIISIPVTFMFMAIGLLLYIFYSRPDLMGVASPSYEVDSSRKVFLSFILNEMPAGMAGLMMAGLFAAGLSSLNSAINAMSSTFINDFYKRFRPGLDDKHYLLAGRIGIVIFGIILGLFGVFSSFWQRNHPETTLIDFALTVMIFSYSGLVAVFLTAIFTRRGNSVSVIAALITGFIVIIIMQTTSIDNKMVKDIIAFPWQMTIATTLAFGVCCLGKRNNSGLQPKVF
ncbi:MAG: sodium:solute symporter [Candidatus Anammoxibacter sp.]